MNLLRQLGWQLLRLLAWQNLSRIAGLLTLFVELKQAWFNKPVDMGLVVLAGGLLGVASAFRKNGDSE